jgi:hypothetical protein
LNLGSFLNDEIIAPMVLGLQTNRVGGNYSDSALNIAANQTMREGNRSVKSRIECTVTVIRP